MKLGAQPRKKCDFLGVLLIGDCKQSQCHFPLYPIKPYHLSFEINMKGCGTLSTNAMDLSQQIVCDSNTKVKNE